MFYIELTLIDGQKIIINSNLIEFIINGDDFTKIRMTSGKAILVKEGKSKIMSRIMKSGWNSANISF